MKTEQLIGKKVRGFKFEKHWNRKMNAYIGLVGLAERIFQNKMVLVLFDNGISWSYPADQIEAHLVEEQNEIPTLSDGVMMLVSDNEREWFESSVMGQKNGLYYVWTGEFIQGYAFCKPLEPTKEEQLTKILGNSDKVAEIMELFNCKE